MAVKQMSVDTQFETPGYSNPDYDAKIDALGQQAKQSFSKNKRTAESGTDKVYIKGKNIPKEELDPYVYGNQAQGTGQYGMINGKDFSTTLRLARAADKYNSMPVQQMMSVGSHRLGGTQNLGTGFSKPALETMETRAMNQAFGLDTNQKQLAQQLQFAVNAKDLELLKQVLTQDLGIQLTDLQVQNVMDQLVKSTEISQLTTKELKQYSDKWSRAFGEETAAALYNMVQGNEAWAAYLGEITTGTVPPGKEDLFAVDFMNNWFTEHNPQNAQQLITEYNAAIKELLKFDIKGQVAQKATEHVYNNWLANVGATLKEFGDQTRGK